MHTFKIVYTEYNEVGALTDNTNCVYADTPEKARQEYDRLRNLYRTVIDPETSEVKARYKMYKVELAVCAYKRIDDPAAFFAQFEI